MSKSKTYLLLQIRISSQTVMYSYLIGVFIITSQMVSLDCGILTKLLCKMSSDAIDAVNQLKTSIRRVLKCVYCEFEAKREVWRKQYSEFMNDTIKKVLKIAPLRESEVENEEDIENENEYLDNDTEIIKTTKSYGTGTRAKLKSTREEPITITTIAYESNISYMARRMSEPINPTKIKNRTEHIFGTYLKLDPVNHHGYNSEVHTVVTPDGYLLTLHRINARTEDKRRIKKRTAILQHGLLGSSMDWISLGPNLSLPYLLINAGFDVWLANSRGNNFSKAHLTKSVHSSDYWDFSWHEIGLYDLSSTIDYVREKSSDKTQIIFIAHSMGATALMVLLATSPQYNSFINLVILLAPLVFMQQAKGPFRLLSEFQNVDFRATEKILGKDKFNPSEAFMKVSRQKFCREEDKTLCLNSLLLLADGGKEINNAKLRRNILTNLPAGGSVKTMLHFGQLINSGKFEMFDGGTKMNVKKYGTVSPPKYHLKEIKIPIALFNSQDDWLSTAPDIVTLLSYLPNRVTHHVVQTADEFGHLDFVLSLNATSLVYKYIFDILDQF